MAVRSSKWLSGSGGAGGRGASKCIVGWEQLSGSAEKKLSDRAAWTALGSSSMHNWMAMTERSSLEQSIGTVLTRLLLSLMSTGQRGGQMHWRCGDTRRVSSSRAMNVGDQCPWQRFCWWQPWVSLLFGRGRRTFEIGICEQRRWRRSRRCCWRHLARSWAVLRSSMASVSQPIDSLWEALMLKSMSSMLEKNTRAFLVPCSAMMSCVWSPVVACEQLASATRSSPQLTHMLTAPLMSSRNIRVLGVCGHWLCSLKCSRRRRQRVWHWHKCPRSLHLSKSKHIVKGQAVLSNGQAVRRGLMFEEIGNSIDRCSGDRGMTAGDRRTRAACVRDWQFLVANVRDWQLPVANIENIIRNNIFSA